MSTYVGAQRKIMSAIIGILGLFFSLRYVFTHPHAGFNGFFESSAVVLIGIAPPCIMLLSHTLSDMIRGIAILAKASINQQSRVEKEVINVLTSASAAVRSDGIGALMKFRNTVRYELLKEGLSLILNDYSIDEIRHNLTARINTKQGHMMLASSLFENMSKLCPGVGMIGTLIGLITMLSNLKDPSTIGGGMAVAMITTLYGLFLGTILYGPFGEKISLESEKSLEIDMMVLEGVLLLKGKKSSVHMKNIMKTYSKGKSEDNNAGKG